MDKFTIVSNSLLYFCVSALYLSGSQHNVLSFSETRAQHLVHHQAERFLTFNQRQLSRIYPSAYRIDSSNFNPQTYWNVGCQLGEHSRMQI